ncbi:MAG: LytR C-terminal domain-containing protein [Gaiellales bacterium]
MAAAENPFLLDTGAWVAVRRRRFAERFALWGLVAGGLVLLAVVAWLGFSLVGKLTHASSSTAPTKAEVAVPAPPITQTPLVVWNGVGADGTAAEAARQLMLKKYPIVSVGDAPDHSYMRTYVMYKGNDPAGKSAANDLIKRMHLDNAVAQPMDGVRKDQLAGARLLMIVADPLTSH